MTLPTPEEVAAQIVPLMQAEFTGSGETVAFVRS
jgi:hypothetical protein